MGKVYLVGAGCGDLDLYTVKAIRCIEEADCIVYDSLVDDTILEKCKENCEKIFVGKRAANHAMEQEDINQLLVDKSKEHNIVVRLKGGDVYVFGRGGEEGQKLYECNVPFEVVPGVSSSIAGLAYAGIPITHRGVSTGFQVYTGTARKNKARKMDFESMLDDECTYVFLMSMSKLELIANGFMEAGKANDTPVAVISNASFVTQRTLVGTLETIVDLFKADPLPNPGLIVVGNVVKMREYLNFFETKPLFGKKVLVGVVGKDHSLKKELHRQGAMVTEVQTGEIQYLNPTIPEIDGYLIFTSKNGVIGFMKAFLNQYHDIRKLAKATIVAIGGKTNQCLNEYGINADLMPAKADSDAINEEFKHVDQKVYLVKGDFNPSVKVYDEVITVYTNKEVTIVNHVDHYDYAFFTNASSVVRFRQSNSSTIDTFVSIGAHTSKAIRDCYGDAKIIEMDMPRKDKMVKKIIQNV